jgi:hypothetical protein
VKKNKNYRLNKKKKCESFKRKKRVAQSKSCIFLGVSVKVFLIQTIIAAFRSKKRAHFFSGPSFCFRLRTTIEVVVAVVVVVAADHSVRQ